MMRGGAMRNRAPRFYVTTPPPRCLTQNPRRLRAASRCLTQNPRNPQNFFLNTNPPNFTNFVSSHSLH